MLRSFIIDSLQRYKLHTVLKSCLGWNLEFHSHLYRVDYLKTSKIPGFDNFTRFFHGSWEGFSWFRTWQLLWQFIWGSIDCQSCWSGSKLFPGISGLDSRSSEIIIQFKVALEKLSSLIHLLSLPPVWGNQFFGQFARWLSQASFYQDFLADVS